MEGLDIEAGTKLLLGAIAEIENFEFTDLVAEALSWTAVSARSPESRIPDAAFPAVAC